MPITSRSGSSPSPASTSRRDFLRAGVLAMGGLTMADVLRLRAEPATAGKRQKSAILIFLSGGPSHLDMYDRKIKGTFYFLCSEK